MWHVLGHHEWTISLDTFFFSCQVWFFTSKHLPLQSSTESKRARASIWHLSDRLLVEAFTLLGWKQSVNGVKQCLCYYLRIEIGQCLCAARHQACWVQVEFTLCFMAKLFEKCSSSLDDRRSNMFFFILQWRFTGYFPCSSRETHLFGGGFAENCENTGPIDPSIERRTYSYIDMNTFRMSYRRSNIRGNNIAHCS